MDSKGYKSLHTGEKDVIAIHGYRKPISGTSVVYDYNRHTIAYQNEDSDAVIAKDDMAPFFRALRMAKAPETQLEWKPLFSDEQSFKCQFEDDMTIQPSIKIDYFLTLLAIRAGNLGSGKGKELLTLFHALSREFDAFEKNILALEPRKSSRHYAALKAQLISEFQIKCSNLIRPVVEKYEKQWDITNILLNLLAMASVIGLFGLFMKNMDRISKGKKLGLFQFEHAHSNIREQLNTLEMAAKNTFLNTETTGTSYFTADPKDTTESIAELETFLLALQEDLNVWDSSNTFPGRRKTLSHMQVNLGKSLDTLRSAKNSENNKAEITFMNSWIAEMRDLDEDESYLSVFSSALITKLMGLKAIAKQFSQEVAALNPDDSMGLGQGHQG